MFCDSYNDCNFVYSYDMIFFTLVIEPVSRTLHDILHTDQTIFDPRTLLQVALDVANGMQYLHEHKLSMEISEHHVCSWTRMV